MLLNLAIMSMLWTASSFNYYLITFFLKYIPGNIFLNTSLASISEIIAYAASGVLMTKVGTKISFMISFALAAVGGVLLASFFSSEELLIATCVLFTKFGVSFAFNVSYQATPQMFPVELCATAFGICNVFARFFTIMSPLVAELPGVTPIIILALSCAGSVFLPLCLVIPKDNKNRKSTK